MLSIVHCGTSVLSDQEEMLLWWSRFRYTCPSDVRKILLKYVKNRFWEEWERTSNIYLSWKVTSCLRKGTWEMYENFSNKYENQ